MLCLQKATFLWQAMIYQTIIILYPQAYMFYPSILAPVHPLALNTLRPRQNGCHFADDIFKCIFLNENAWIPIKISMKFVPKSPINNIPALVQIMAWSCPSDKPLTEPMMVSLTTQICITGPQWVGITKLANIDSDNGLWPIRHKVIIYSNDAFLLIGPMGE